MSEIPIPRYGLLTDDTPPVKGEPHHGRRLPDMEIRGAMLTDFDMELYIDTEGPRTLD